MSLSKLKVQNFKLKKFYYTEEENDKDVEIYNDLSKKIDILNSNINTLKNNFGEYKDAKNIMLKQYSLLRTGQFPATYYHPKVIVEVGACNSTTRSFRLSFRLLPQTWATIGSMT